jgi:large subunit ribosomal protein L21
MYAIVEIAGKQFRVKKDQCLQVPLLPAESGSKIKLDKVLLYNDDKSVKIGTPTVDKINVSATVLEHGREKKIVVFKKKRRKGYQVKNGHRQDYSMIKIDSISAVKAAASKKKPAAEAKEDQKEA